MNKKILSIGALGLFLVMSLVMVSAIEITYEGYDKKAGVISYEKVLEDECSPVDVTIINHKGNVVGGYSRPGICSICYGGSCSYYTATGTYSIKNY